MGKEELQGKLSWFLVVTNAIAGALWLLAALGIVKGGGGINPLYLVIGVSCLVASGTWLLSQRSS